MWLLLLVMQWSFIPKKTASLILKGGGTMNANDDYGSIVVACCSIFLFTDNAPVERRVPKSIRLSSCEKPAFLRCSRLLGDITKM